MLAEPLKAEQAEAWGMIWKAVDDDKLEAEVEGVLARLAASATYGLGLTKQALEASSTNDLAAQLLLERDLHRAAAQSPDYAEGVAAFQAKRPPAFTGRKG
jgi:2-(1,2-epoxy-1,2-dihydrophenyl)acetyl-CoA isomerase